MEPSEGDPLIQTEGQVLITGCYRTGTEYITHLIGNSPDLVATMYVVNFFRYSYGRFDPISDPRNQRRLLEDARERIQSRWELRLDSDAILRELDEAPSASYAGIWDRMMDDLFLDEDTRTWAEKNQLHWTKIPTFLDMFPDGKAIHIHRDPRSVLASFREFTYTPPPAYLGAVFNILDSMQKGLDYQEQLPDDRYASLRYEDVVQDPGSAMERVFEFLGLPAEHDLASQEGWTDPRGEPWGANSAFSDGSSFDPQDAIHRWKGTLEPWEVALCEHVNAPEMEQFGYEPSGETMDEADLVERLEGDLQLERFWRRWKDSGEGVEAFPRDPTKEENWSENRA